MSATVMGTSHPQLGPGERPVSRTHQYRKVTKPLLERRRRARINGCLDELKELMASALRAEGENVAKLEKADILELTVRHLRRQKRKESSRSSTAGDEGDKFRAGFAHAAAEVSRCLAATPGVDVQLGTRLMTHLGHRLNDMSATAPATTATPALRAAQRAAPPTPPCTPPPSPSPITADPHEPLDCSRVKRASAEPWRPW